MSQAQAICSELGYELVDYEIEDPSQIDHISEKAVASAESDGGVVVAAGGDGTIRAVAQAAAGRNVRFAVIPCGTFNYFARGHKIPEDPVAAFRLALEGEAKPVRLGKANNHVFLINASLGLYAKAIRERKQWTSKFGRHRLVAVLSTLRTFLSGHRLLDVDLVVAGKNVSMQTPMIFIGNNALQLRDLEMDVAQCMSENSLGVVLLKPLTKLEILRVISRGFLKTLDSDNSLITFCVDEMTIHSDRRSHSIALDGEIMREAFPLRIQSLPGVLNLVVPSEG